MPQFTPEEQTAARDYADSWVFGSTLEHVRVAAKAVPPPRAESLALGPLRAGGAGRGGGGGGGAQPFPLKTLAGGPPARVDKH